jgi:hypothetical protein
VRRPGEGRKRKRRRGLPLGRIVDGGPALCDTRNREFYFPNMRVHNCPVGERRERELKPPALCTHVWWSVPGSLATQPHAQRRRCAQRRDRRDSRGGRASPRGPTGSAASGLPPANAHFLSGSSSGSGRLRPAVVVIENVSGIKEPDCSPSDTRSESVHALFVSTACRTSKCPMASRCSTNRAFPSLSLYAPSVC